MLFAPLQSFSPHLHARGVVGLYIKVEKTKRQRTRRECDEAKGLTVASTTSMSSKRWHSFFSFASLSLALAGPGSSLLALSYLAEVAEQHALPVGGSRRFHGFLERERERKVMKRRGEGKRQGKRRL